MTETVNKPQKRFLKKSENTLNIGPRINQKKSLLILIPPIKSTKTFLLNFTALKKIKTL